VKAIKNALRQMRHSLGLVLVFCDGLSAFAGG
jgi:hypothetical protein